MIMLITHDCHTIVNEAKTSLLKKLQKKKKKLSIMKEQTLCLCQCLLIDKPKKLIPIINQGEKNPRF